MNEIIFLENELWYGGAVAFGEKYPIGKEDEFSLNLSFNQTYNQLNPVFFSNKGRYLWFEDGGRVSFRKGKIQIDAPTYELNVAGRTLKEAVLLTARHRGRILESDAFMRIGEFAEDPFMKTQWIRFEPAKEAGLEFSEVLHRLDQFLHPIYDAILKGEEFDRQWSCSQKAWE